MGIPQGIILEIPDILNKNRRESISGSSSEKLHCLNVVNMPYLMQPM